MEIVTVLRRREPQP